MFAALVCAECVLGARHCSHPTCQLVDSVSTFGCDYNCASTLA
jgi:hypothetical protein